MADAESLIEGKGTVKKNIHWFIGGLVALVIVIAIFAQDASSQKRKIQKQKEAATQVPQADSNPDAIKGALEKQKEVPLDNSPGDLANSKLGVPEIAKDGVGRSQAETEAISAKEAQAIEDARREAQLNGSSILAISNDASSLEQLGRLQQQQQAEAPTRLAVNENDLRQALAGPTLEPEVIPQKVLTKEEKDQEWLNDLSKKNKTNPITEDTVNSPYTIFQGAVIPAVLMTKITSQLPGQVTGIVSQDVYDGVTGSHIVIPKGSTVYGSYNNSISQGQSRLTVAFTRLILPNGRSVSLLGMPAADKVGQHGLEGDVNNRYFQRFGFSFLTAVLGVIVDKNNSNNTTIINTGGGTGAGVSTAAGTILTDMSRAEQQRSEQIKPIVTIKQGEKFNINVNRDISIEPYK